ncbi:hypothetical protein [Nocardia sp. NPDC049707]|uniref:hypothetical protein n=1 Tax=Nocardia sp. NPDC049707 TaxID=3154735 RepID=UPI0034455958
MAQQITSNRLHDDGLTTGRFDHGSDLLGGLVVVLVIDDDVRSVRGEAQCEVGGCTGKRGVDITPS